MIRRQHYVIWPLLCVLTGIFLLSAISPRIWELASRGQAVADSPSMKVAIEPDMRVVDRQDRQPHGPGQPSADAVRPAPPDDAQWSALPRPIHVSPTPVIEPTTAKAVGEPQPVALAASWETPRSRVPFVPSLARGVVPHEEVLSLSDGEGTDAERPPLIARMPAPIQPVPDPLPPAEHVANEPEDVVLPKEPALPQPAAEEVVPAVTVAWQEPAELLERLDALAAEPATRSWAQETGRLVRSLGPAVSEPSDEAAEILQGLEESVGRVAPLAATLRARSLASSLRRAGYALNRRLNAWRQIVHLNRQGSAAAGLPQADPEQLALCLAEFDAATGDTPAGKAWRRFLLVDALQQWLSGRASAGERLPQALAQRALQRLTRTEFSPAQRRFVSSEPVTALRTELQRWTAEPVDLTGLLGHVERYEQTGLSSDARRLAEDCSYLSLFSAEHQRRLAESLQRNYRNANVRVVVTEALLNRLMPEQDSEVASVRDRVLGVPVRGRSRTSTDVAVQLLPDPNRVRLALKITGNVATLTSSTSGPATFYNDSHSMYTARKPLEIDLKGIRLWPAEVDVYNNTRLRGVRTEFDPMPLVGPLVNNFARRQHEQSRPEAVREIKRKVSLQARDRIDTETEARLTVVSRKLGEKVLRPLGVLSLDPTMISSETTRRRLTMRLRLAGEDQLGAHTPRPQAPADSLTSFQVHQTAINNMLQRLELDGRTFTLPELSRHVATRLSRSTVPETDPNNDDVTITFAKQDALGVRLQDGRVVLTMAVAKLRKSPHSWTNFQVRVFYQPRVDGRSVQLVRDGILHLIGSRLRTSSQIALRGVFARTFPKRRPINLIPEELVADPRLADLAVTQFVIADGWIGAALGPEQTALRQTLLRR